MTPWISNNDLEHFYSTSEQVKATLTSQREEIARLRALGDIGDPASPPLVTDEMIERAAKAMEDVPAGLAEWDVLASVALAAALPSKDTP